MFIKELLMFVAAVCGQPEVLKCEVQPIMEDQHYNLYVYTTNRVMERNDFMTTGGQQVKINVVFLHVTD